MSILSAPYFHNEKAAFEYLESVLWQDGPECPHCGVVNRASKMKGKATRIGLWKCYACREQFRATVGTVFEHLRLPLHKALQAAYLMSSSKKGISAHQLHRMLGITYKSAWFLSHRIREAMREGKLPEGLGGANKVVEADETYVGGKAKNRAYAKEPPKKAIVFALVERGGKVRSRHVADVTGDTLREAIVTQASRKSHLVTDEAPQYVSVGSEFAGHSSVNHSADEYVRLGGFVHTNTIEGYFSILKRGVIGTFHHVSEAHLHRYLAEFDFRYNHRVGLGVNDTARTGEALRGIRGKRLTYGGSAEKRTTAT